MNFLTIHYFLTLVEERNFTRAAERLHVTQQTLSGHIAMVEREVGMKLFIRHVPLELTDGGEVFYRYARIFQRNELAFRRALSDVSGSESGVLRIGVAPARGEVLLPPLLEVFHRRYPRVRIVLCEMANAMIRKALEREEIDPGVGAVGRRAARCLALSLSGGGDRASSFRRSVSAPAGDGGREIARSLCAAKGAACFLGAM